MRVTGVNGREYVWNLTPYDVFYDDTRKRSKFHIRARNLIRELYHSYRILEEVKLPGSTATHKKGVLYLDFFIPTIMLGVEVHGQQHYQFTPFFHKSKADFARSQTRDAEKERWCELNNIDLIILPYSESDDEWRKRLKGI